MTSRDENERHQRISEQSRKHWIVAATTRVGQSGSAVRHETPALRFSRDTQEPQMNQRAMSLMDVLTPPGNTWLRELSRRTSDLPVGVRIVRFNGDDNLAEDMAELEGTVTRGKMATA
jgi:hypothetical protein